MTVALIGGLLVLAGAALLYAGAPNQRLWPDRRRRTPLLAAGGLSLAAALPLLLAFAGPATAIVIWLTLATTIWSILPLLVAWRRDRGAKR